ncbi:MAG: phosphate acetyltransferase [Pseudomonadota bacterium]
MSLFDPIRAAARKQPGRIVLPEGEDIRVITAAAAALADGTAKPLLLGNPEQMRAKADQVGVSLDGIECLDMAALAARTDLIDLLVERRKHKGMTVELASKHMQDPVVAALATLAAGEADGFVGGAVAATAHVLRWAFGLVGTAEGVRQVSSFFLMLLEQAHHDPHEAVLFADCALIIEPDAAGLAGIAQATGDSVQSLLGQAPRVAMLSFSSVGSAEHDRVEKVREATAMLKAAKPDWQVVGEIQFDAAFVPEILTRKAPDQSLDGRANVFVFPNLEAGNIGYKLAERLGGCTALGPVIQGLSKPVNDLSRGCSAADVEAVMAITSVQAESGA